MNNLIIFHLFSFIFTIANCGKFSSTKQTTIHLKKIKYQFWLSLIIGISLLIVISLILILLYRIYIRQRIKSNQTKNIKRKQKDYDIPIVSYNNINELDTIQTVGIPSEFIDHNSEMEVKTII